MKRWVDLVSFLLSASGASVGMLGSLMMAHAYHPQSLVGFVRTIPKLCADLLRYGVKRLIRQLELRQATAQINKENRTFSLAGLYLIFLGFLLQLIGTAVSYISTWFG